MRKRPVNNGYTSAVSNESATAITQKSLVFHCGLYFLASSPDLPHNERNCQVISINTPGRNKSEGRTQKFEKVGFAENDDVDLLRRSQHSRSDMVVALDIDLCDEAVLAGYDLAPGFDIVHNRFGLPGFNPEGKPCALVWLEQLDVGGTKRLDILHVQRVLILVGHHNEHSAGPLMREAFWKPLDFRTGKFNAGNRRG